MNARLPSLFLRLAVLCAAGPLLAQEADDKAAPKIVLRVEADYVALHASGTAPAGTGTAEHRLTLSGAAAQPGPWTVFPIEAADGSFRFDVPLPEWRWARLEVRAMVNGQALTATREKPPERTFTMLTPARIAALPETQRVAWQAYMETSMRHAAHERDVLAAECRELAMPASRAAPLSSAEFEFSGETKPALFASAEALKLVPAILSYQTPSGGWSKAVDYASGTRAPGTQWTSNAGNPWHYCGTLDNRSTTEQIWFLANMYATARHDDARVGALRGIEWLLAAQFPNGGWPQVYPIEPGYHEAITLNDGAMQHALELLLAVSRHEAPFGFAFDQAVRERAAEAVAKGIACLLECQVKVDGKPTVWCAQHHPITLEPVAARLKEPPSLSGAESAELLKFLMRKGPATPEVIQTIQSGIDWLSAHRITNLRKTKDAGGKTDYVEDAASDEVYWARFYDVNTGKPIFAGAQDGRIYTTFHEMAQHNKVAYAYFTTKPAEIIGKETEPWKTRVQKNRPGSDLAALDQSLTALIERYFPDAEIKRTDTSYTARHGTMEFTVHGSSKTGEIAAQTHKEQGPNFKGFLLEIEQNDGAYQGAAAIPQHLQRPYWTTLIDARSVSGQDKHLFIRFAYGGRLNAEFQKAVLAALSRSKP